MARIDPTARIADGAQVADDVEIGPYCVVGPAVELRQGVRLKSHVCIDGVTVVGERTVVHPFAVLGSAPQAISYKGEPTRLTIGADCVIREAATMCTGTVDGGGITRVGDRGYFMAYSHVGHDCQVGNDVIFANNATLGGHVVLGDFVFLGGLAAVHQFCRIGSQVMIAGMTAQRSDVIPFALAQEVKLRGINVVGMRRRKFSNETIRVVRTAYRKLFHGGGVFAERVDAVEKEFAGSPAVAEMVGFIRAERRHRLCFPDIKTQSDQDPE